MNDERQLDRWRQAQAARRARMKDRGRVLCRIWCMPEQVDDLKKYARELRRADLLRKLRARAPASTLKNYQTDSKP